MKRFRYFPVLNADNEFVGFISRRRILEFNKKQVILVDHNEVSQAVEGLEECEIMEIIDHHRIGSVETVSPVTSEISQLDVQERSLLRCTVNRESRLQKRWQD